MTTTDGRRETVPEVRRRGGIRRHGNGFQIRVSAGEDPSAGQRIVLHETVPIEPAASRSGQEKAERVARKKADEVLTRLLAEADSLKVARTKSTLGALLDKWLLDHEIDPTTRMNYESQIRNYIRPNLGDVPLLLLVRDASERLERFYGHLRRCRQLCNGKPFIEEHAVQGRHDCAAAKCRKHVCRPYAASSVRQIHAIISGAMSAAVRWGRLVTKLTITTALKELRHYSATELLTAGIDLRTVAGRLGHGDGTTTLRHYAAWVGAADKNAATTIASKMPVLPGVTFDSEADAGGAEAP